MEKYKNAELKLNEYPDPTSFHDMSAVSMKIIDDNIIIRFSLVEYMDDFGILDDDEHRAILEVKYEGINVVKLNMQGIINFNDLDVLFLQEKNNIMELDLYDETYDCYFHMHFTFKNYKWKVIDVVTEEEYYEGVVIDDEIWEVLSKAQEYKGPEWSNIE